MTFPLPANSLYLYGDSFYNVVKQFCGDEAVELLKFQLIDTSMNLLEVDDVFSILNFESDRTAALKEKLGVPCKDEFGASSLIFPKHHKQSQQIHQLPTMITTTTITEQIIEETVYSVYLEASQILSGCNLSILNPNGKYISFEEVNRLAHQKLTRSQCKTFSKRENQSNSDKQEEDEDLEQYLSQKQSSGTNIMDDLDEPLLDDESGADTFSNQYYTFTKYMTYGITTSCTPCNNEDSNFDNYDSSNDDSSIKITSIVNECENVLVRILTYLQLKFEEDNDNDITFKCFDPSLSLLPLSSSNVDDLNDSH
ncbi:unnamed protein product [Rotaria sordida]|uniref:Uncharacterized protein n=1 Tax=Rotaria sordida TaxID=392033 RepID=A0A814PP20_9BILA|nr:unnamed protein product [Rotaria sordida]